jgi:hypothetical protein
MASDLTSGHLTGKPQHRVNGLGQGTEEAEPSVQDDNTSDPYDCSHALRTLRVKTLSNGALQYRRQCLSCGNGGQSIRKDEAARELALADIPPYDELAEDAWYAQRREAAREASAQRAAAEVAAKLTAHANYLATPEWKTKRRKVLERDNWICQAKLPCCTGRAEQAHHLTYDHWGSEPLFDLISVCTSCHDQITRMDREARARVFK